MGHQITGIYSNICSAPANTYGDNLMIYLYVMLSSCSAQNCVASLKALVVANDVTTSKSLCRLSWKPHGGKALAVPVESEVKIYERLTWKPKWSLKDEYHQKVN